MMSGLQDVVRIGDAGLAWVALRTNGSPDHGWPAIIDFKAASFEGQREVNLMGLDQFRDQLEELNRSLKGRAELGAWDRDFALAIDAVGSTGHLKAEVTVSERWGGPVEFEFNFTFTFDQSYLSPIIAGLNRHFPKRPAQ